MIVEVGDAVICVDHENHLVGLLDGHGYLFVDFLFEDVVGVDHPAAGVDDRKFAATPFHFAILAVAGGAGRGVYDGLTRLGEAVEEGGLAHIGAPYDSYKLTHISRLRSC